MPAIGEIPSTCRLWALYVFEVYARIRGDRVCSELANRVSSQLGLSDAISLPTILTS